MVIADTLAGIRRGARARPSARKAAITASDLAKMIAAADGQGTRAIRDRAILALGLAAALRRSELVALEWRDVVMVDKGLKLTLRHSKTDQEGEGQVIAVPSGKTLKPVERLKVWLAVRGGNAGPLFYQIDPQGRLTDQPMSDRSIARLIQKYAGLVGHDQRGQHADDDQHHHQLDQGEAPRRMRGQAAAGAAQEEKGGGVHVSQSREGRIA